MDNGQTNPSQAETTDEMLQAYTQDLPGFMQVYNAQQTPSAQAQLAAQQATQPGYDALNLRELQQFGLPTANIQQQIANSNAQAGASTNLGLLNGAGGQAARTGQALNRELNPDYFRATEAASRGSADAVNAINLNGLSPGEAAAVERSGNKQFGASGNLGVMNNTNAITNAMNFGGAFNGKLGLMNNATNAAATAANAASSNAGYNAMGTALGTGQVNSGTSFTSPQIGQTQSPTATNVPANTLLGAQGQIADTWQGNQAKANYANSLQGWAASFGGSNVFGGQGGQGAGNCCFIFLEIHNGVLPWYVRMERDKWYKKAPKVADGYKRMAKWLVPVMRSNWLTRIIVNFTMVKPLTYYGGWLHKQNKLGFLCYPAKSLWFITWRIYGI